MHILFVIAAVGGNLTYGFWIATASASPQNLPHVLRRVRDFDRFVANPAYVLVLLSGIAMAWLVWGLTDWILLSLVLWVIAMGMGTGLFLPVLKRQIDALDRHGFHSQTYQALAKRGTLFGLLNMVPIVLVLILMVFKPDGWF